MTTASKALTGKRVYRSSSYAPTRGTNKPKGYIERELRNRNKPQRALKLKPMKRAEPITKKMPGVHGVSKVGKDGQSDTRSGLAASAMRTTPPKIPNVRKKSQFKNNKGKGKPGKPGRGLLGASLNTPQYRPISINANGRLDLPFDYAAGQDSLEKQQEANRNLLELQQQSQEQATAYLQQMRQANQGYDVAKKQTLNQNAARGTAFSSAYGSQLGQNATQYNNQVNDLNSQNTLFGNYVTSQRNAITGDLNDFLRQQALQRGVSLAGEAGTLGFGTSGGRAGKKKKRANIGGVKRAAVKAAPGLKRKAKR